MHAGYGVVTCGGGVWCMVYGVVWQTSSRLCGGGD